MNDKPKLVVGLVWFTLRSQNLGVGALTIAQLEILRAVSERIGIPIECVIIGPRNNIFYSYEDLPIREVRFPDRHGLTPGSEVWKALAACDIVIDNGAGDSFSDIYGPKRYFWIAITKVMTLLLGKPLVLAPQTIGPFKSAWARISARTIMKRCRHIYARDAKSMKLLTELDLADQAVETVDVAFRLPFTKIERHKTGKIRFGLNVSALLYSGGYTGKNQFDLAADYPTFIRTLITRILERGDTEIVMIPHVLAEDPQEDDYATSLALQKQFPEIAVAPRFTSPSEAKSFISSLDILAGSRMHATIAAVSSGIAVVPLAYSRKFAGVFDSVNYPLVGDCTSQSIDELVTLTLSALDRIPELQTAAAQSCEVGIERLKLYEDALVETFKTL